MPDTKPTNTMLETALKIVPILVPILLGILALLSHEEWLFLALLTLTVCIVLVVFASYCFPNMLCRTSSILEPTTGEPIKTPLLRRRTLNFTLLVAAFCIFAVFLWYRFGYEIAPSASIIRFEQSKIRYLYESKHNSTEVPVNSFFVPAGNPDNLDDVKATSYSIMTVVRNGEFRTKSLRIESLDFQIVHTHFVKWKRRKGIYPKNVVLPFRYSASVSPLLKRVKAHMLDEKGNPTENTIILDNETKSSDIHVSFKAAPGAGTYELYEVRPIVTTIDEAGRRTELAYDKTLFVAVWNDDTNNPDDMKLLMKKLAK